MRCAALRPRGAGRKVHWLWKSLSPWLLRSMRFHHCPLASSPLMAFSESLLSRNFFFFFLAPLNELSPLVLPMQCLHSRPRLSRSFSLLIITRKICEKNDTRKFNSTTHYSPLVRVSELLHASYKPQKVPAAYYVPIIPALDYSFPKLNWFPIRMLYLWKTYAQAINSLWNKQSIT